MELVSYYIYQYLNWLCVFERRTFNCDVIKCSARSEDDHVPGTNEDWEVIGSDVFQHYLKEYRRTSENFIHHSRHHGLHTNGRYVIGLPSY
jgi:hypothetical protein